MNIILGHPTRLLLLTALVALAPTVVRAQESSQYDRGTPPQHAAGLGQFGTYASADLGTVNLSNGSLNFRVPLAEVGGRGFSLPLTLDYSSKVWSAAENDDIVNEPIYRKYKGAYAVYDSPDDGADFYQRVAPGWTVGAVPLLRVNGVGISQHTNSSNGCTDYEWVVTKLTLMLPDKGEIELRDDATDGAPLGTSPDSSGCKVMDGNRSRRWHATDGSGIIFVGDADNAVTRGDLRGWIVAADGTRYRFSGGASTLGSAYLRNLSRATSITDRHGNTVTIDYLTSPALGVRYTDQLGRTTEIAYNAPDPETPGQTLALLVTVKGFRGQPHYFKVRTGVMNQHYRSGINPQLPVYNGWVQGMSGDEDCGTAPSSGTLLFTGWCGGAERVDDREVLTQLELPNHRTLDFTYNEYGEVAEVALPTGGRVRYDYAYAAHLPSGNSPGFEVNPSPGPGNVYAVDRAVTARRILPDGQSVAAYWSYVYSATTDTATGAATGGLTEVIARAADNSTVLSRERHYFMDGGRFLTLQGGTGYALWSTGLERRSEALDAAGANVLSAAEQDWSQRAPVAWASGYTTEQAANDNRVGQARRYLDTGAFAKTVTLYDDAHYPRANNVAEVQEYDYDQSLKRRTTTAYLISNNGYNYQTDDSIHLLHLPRTTTAFDGDNRQLAQTSIAYDEAAYLLPNYANAPFNWTSPAVPAARGDATTASRWLDTTNSWLSTHGQYDEVGNVRSTWDARGIQSQVSYDDSFTSYGHCTVPGQPGVPCYTYAFPTSTTSAAPDPTGQRGSSTPLTTSTAYDYWGGLAVSTTDANSQTTSYGYDDPLDRLRQVNLPDGGRTTYAYVDQHVCGPYVQTRTLLDASGRETDSYQFYDGLGRPYMSESFDGQDAANPWQRVDTRYDPMSRVSQVSNPYRSSGCTAAANPSGRWTTTSYDSLSRVRTVTTPDSAAVTTDYSGNHVTVMDQAGKARSSVSDALGRLTSVTEAPGVAGYGFVTNYTYDALGNLRKIDQGGQLRFFMYDSLSRLIRVKNPEQDVNANLGAATDPVTSNSQWSIAYSYDEDCNLASRTDARGVTTTYTHDNLNRVIRTDYTTLSAYTLFTYDFATTNGRGRPYSDYESSAQGTSNYVTAYDPAGRPAARNTTFYVSGSGWTPGYATTRQYDLAGHVTSQTYPSGHTVSYSYDAAGRLADNGSNAAFSGNLGDGAQRAYSRGLSYDEASRLQQEQFGTQTPLYHKLHYNVRGQLNDIRLSTVRWQPGSNAGQWDWNRGALLSHYSQNEIGAQTNDGHSASGPENNGDVLRSDVYVPTQEAANYDGVNAPGAYFLARQDYGYDPLNRLSSISESNNAGAAGIWQSYSYDRWGNRTNTSASGGAPSRQFDTNDTYCTSRLYAPGDTNGQCAPKPAAQRQMRYDPAGNLTYDAYAGAGGREYDAENRMTSAWGGDPASGTYSSQYLYDAEGSRTRRTVNGVTTWQVYGFGGELLAEYAQNGAPSSPQKEYGYRGGELLVTAQGGGGSNGSRTNVASATSGATASASSFDPDNAFCPGTHTRPSDAIDGARSLTETACGTGFWRAHPLPGQWLEVDFAGQKTISEIDVYTQRDNYTNQSDPPASETFTSGGLTDFSLQYWDGSAWAQVPGASASGNNLVWRKFTFAALTTQKIRVVVTGATDGVARVVELEAWADPSAVRTNVALAANGGVATAQNYTQDSVYPGLHFQPAYANDGDHHIEPPQGDRDWRDEHGLQTWLQIDFAGGKTINEIDVYLVGDYPSYYSDPTDTTTFAQHGSTSFDVQYWTGSAWQTVPGGSVSGNNLVLRKFSFASVTTSKIRVVDNSEVDGVARIAEVEAYAAANGGVQGTTPEIDWLVSDRLGSPRMAVDQTGSFSAVRRFDYLPFGEEIGAGAGGRTAAQGYVAGNVRQKFTGKERDSETGLDYFLARYYSNSQGRFTSVDPLMASGSVGNPQSWNRYAYAFNNPLRFTDPTGMLVADFYDQGGKQLGTDGNDDGKVYVVTDGNEAKQIQKTDKAGGTTQVADVSSAVELPDFTVRQAIGDAVDRSNSPTSDDKKGGFHEEGLLWGTTADGAGKIINATPGAYADPQVDTKAEINLSKPANPADAGVLTSVGGGCHVHPKGEVEVTTGPASGGGMTVIGGATKTTTYNFVQPPSGADKAAALPGRTNIVVGARDKTVYIYDGSGVRATFPLKQFLSIGKK